MPSVARSIAATALGLLVAVHVLAWGADGHKIIAPAPGSGPSDLLTVTDLLTVKQTTTAVSVVFDDDAVADFFEQQVEAGRWPEHFARIWVHTHPGDSPPPSATDEETFDRVFGGCD